MNRKLKKKKKKASFLTRKCALLEINWPIIYFSLLLAGSDPLSTVQQGFFFSSFFFFNVEMTSWRVLEMKSILRHSCAHADDSQSPIRWDGGFKGTVRVAYMCELHCDVSLYKRTFEGGREGRPEGDWWKLPRCNSWRGAMTRITMRNRFDKLSYCF